VCRVGVCRNDLEECTQCSLNLAALGGSCSNKVLEQQISEKKCECEPRLEINDYVRDADRACQMRVQHMFKQRGKKRRITCETSDLWSRAWSGMSIWRYLLFLGIFWPLDLLARIMSRVIAAAVSYWREGGNVRPGCKRFVALWTDLCS
jgi:hypothetical protein